MVALALGTETATVELQTLGSIASYDLMERLAQGGMGVVYKAHQPALDRSVALKLLAPHATGSADALRRFQTETAAAAGLHHPNILPIYESGEEDGQAYYSMPLMEGGTLADRLQRRPVDPKEAAHLMRKIAAAVGYAHQQGVLHRDLKPQNIFLAPDGEPYVADFGLANHVLANLSRLARRQGDLTAEITYAREAVQAAHRVYPEGHPIRRQSEKLLERVIERRIATARERGESERIWQAELDALTFTGSSQR